METEPIQLIRDFVHEYLHDDLNALATFRLYDLRKDKKYGCPGRSFDSDDTNLMRAIYCVLFADVWPGLTMNSLADYTYRGDTMNTYNTMFGKPGAESLHPGLDRFNPSPELVKKVECFQQSVCGTIGNMTVLPNVARVVDGERETINTYRGCHAAWRDFFDRFLVALQAVLRGDKQADEPLQQLVQLNKDAFSAYIAKEASNGAEDSAEAEIPAKTDRFACLSKALLWNDYLSANGVPQVTSKGFYYWRQYGMKAYEYLQEAERYVDFSTKVIQHRAALMIDLLKQKLDSNVVMVPRKKFKTVDPVAIGELVGMDFHIPSYQRGYRWTTQQVKELLDDIGDFCTKGAKGIYCIQPLVVKPQGAFWEVIDGQQRLTTINMLLSCLQQEKYRLSYETRPQSEVFLTSILQRTALEAQENIDFYHMLQARDYMLYWLQAHKDLVLNDKPFIPLFTNVLLQKVKFIWYDTDTQDPIEVFTRLNIDKIPLTSAELIKAMLLNRSNFSSQTLFEQVRLLQQDIASQWNEMEAMLQNDEFWLFFHDDADALETRIDYLFELICNERMLGEPVEDIGTDASRVFRYFAGYFHEHRYCEDTLKQVWSVVKQIFNTLYEWFTQLELYHYVGYLMARPKESTRQKANALAQQALLYKLLEQWNAPGMTVAKFKNFLRDEINETLRDCADLGKVYESKGCPKTQCRPLLLLHNVESVVQQGQVMQQAYDQPVFARFPFNLYKREKWDVEHIDSNTTNDLTDFADQKEWLLTSYLVATDAQREEIKQFCETMQNNDNDAERKQAFDRLAHEILPDEQADDRLTEDEKNQVWNFTLLDEGTNRSYGNAIFPAKRRTIIGKEQGVCFPTPMFTKEKGFVVPKEYPAKSSFIPLCTKQAFMKYYNPLSGSLVAWTRRDADAYRENIYRTLSKKFNIIDYVSDSL